MLEATLEMQELVKVMDELLTYMEAAQAQAEELMDL
jgi:hypothetical protein